MSLTQKPHRCIKVVGQLENPHPVFVSLVGHGANQTPFKTIKHDEPVSLMKIDTTTGMISLAKGVQIEKFVFATSKMDEAAATDFMTKNGYEGFAFEKSEDGSTLTVKGVDSASFEAISEVPLQDGAVTVFCGNLKEVLTKSDQKPALWLTEKGESITKKWDWYLSHYSDEKTLKEVMDAGLSDGIPIGFREVSESFEIALSNVVKSGEYASIATLAGEYGEYLSKLANFVTTSVAKGAESPGLKTVIDRFMAKPEAAPVVEGDKTQKGDAKTPVEGETVSKADFDALVARLDAVELATKAAVTKDELGLASKQVDEKLTLLTSATETAKKTADNVETRVVAMESLRQRRKSEDPVTPTPVVPETVIKSEMTRADKNALGIRE